MQIRRHGVLPIVVGLLLGSSLSGCGGEEGATGSEAVKGPLAPDKLVEQAKQNPLQPYPSQKGELPQVHVARSVPALSFAALDLAVAMNFFEYNGVKVKFTELEAGSTALQGLLGGSIDMVDSASVEMAASTAQGAEVLAVENTSMMTMQICVRKDWASKKGVDESSDLKDRVRALKGAKIAISGPGAASDRNIRWLLKEYGGLDPNKEVDILQVGGAPAMSGALDENQVQAFMLSAPNCDQTQNGMVLVQPQDVPQFANYIHEVLYGTKEWVEENAGSATRVATAVAMGNNFLLTHTDEAIKMLQKQYSEVDPEIIANAVKDSIIPNVKKHGVMDRSMWKNTSQVLVDAGFVKEPLDVTEGQFWTNDYIRKDEAVVHE